MIEPTTTFSGLRDLLKDRRAQLHRVVKSLGDGDDPVAPVADRRREERLALADEAEQLGGELDGLCQRWIEPVRADPSQGDKMLAEYHATFRTRTVRIFKALVNQGLADPALEPSVKQPPDVNDIDRIAQLVNEAAARLRTHNPELADWLEERIDEVRGFQAELREQIARPVPDIDRTDSIQDNFTAMNNDVIRRLRRDAPAWVGYYHETPDWFYGGLTRLTGEQFEELVRVYDYTIDQLARIAEQVR